MRGKSIYTVVTSTEHGVAVLRDAFMLLSTISPEALRETRLSSIAVTSIRHFLSSRDPNDLYLFVSCLSCLDPGIWAGTHPSTVAILDEWEVQGVMRLLDSPDGLIRKTVVHPWNVFITELTVFTIRHSRFSILSIRLSSRRTIRKFCTTCRRSSVCQTRMHPFRVCLKSSTCKMGMT